MITIKQAGYYKIELTALLTLNKFQHRFEVYKKSTSDSTCNENNVLLGVYARDNDSVRYGSTQNFEIIH